jgi:prophage DNA circulation protein
MPPVRALRTELADRLDVLMEAAGDPVYKSLADLRAAVVRDLTVRGADLARTARYTPKQTLPALAVAYRIYGDASRDEEIAARNRIRHPGFVPGGETLEVLSDV